MNVTELKSLAKTLGVTGYSKMRKADLIVAIGDACYAEAVEMDAAMSRPTVSEAEADTILDGWVNTLNGEAGKPRKSYTERMLNRIQGYYTQNGCTRLTAKQNRRQEKKYRKQYGNLLVQLGVAS